MKLLQLVAAGLLAFGVAAAGAQEKKGDEKKSNAEKIVGTWEVTKGETVPDGSTVEFTKDGKLKMSIKLGDKTETIEGTYKVDGDNLKVTLKGPGGKNQEETMKIKSLTDKEFVTVDDEKKTDTFKKK